MDDMNQEDIHMDGTVLNIFGSEYLKSHPSYVEQESYTPQWIICNRDTVEYELYWQGSILVCLKGTHLQKVLVKMVTVDLPIQQSIVASLKNESCQPEDYLIVVSDVNLHFYSFNGEDVLRALPFHGAKIWALSPSLLIHKKQGTSSQSEFSSTVCLLSPLDEYTYVQLDSNSNRESMVRESFLDSSYQIISILHNGDSRYIVTLDKGALVVWRLNQVDRSSVALHTDNFTPPDDIEVLKSRLGMTVFTPNSAKFSSKFISNSTPKQQVDRERNPSSNVSSFAHPNITPGGLLSDVPHSTVNNTLLSATRMSSMCYVPGYNLTKVYSDRSLGGCKNVKVLVYESYAGIKYLAVLNQNAGTLQSMVLVEDQVQPEPVTIPCRDAAYMPLSKFLVVLDTYGSLLLYDGTSQVGQMKKDGEGSVKPATKKVRTRSASGGTTNSRIVQALPAAFILQDEQLITHYCLVPPVADVAIVRSTVDSIISLHNRGAQFYQILARIILTEKTKYVTNTWAALQDAILRFTGFCSSPVQTTLTQHDPSIRRTRHTQINEDWEFMLNIMKEQITHQYFGLPGLPHVTLKEGMIPPAPRANDTELVLQILHILHTEYRLDCRNQAICHDLAVLIHHIALAGSFPHYAHHYRLFYPHLGDPASLSTQVDPELSICSLESYLTSLISREEFTPFEVLSADLSPLTEAILILYFIAAGLQLRTDNINYLIPGSTRIDQVATILSERNMSSVHENLLLAMVTLDIDLQGVLSLPEGIQIPLLEMLHPAHSHPPVGLPPPAYLIVQRRDVINDAVPRVLLSEEQCSSAPESSVSCPILDFRFAEDKRVDDVRKMFNSSSSVKIVVNRRAEMTDAEYTDQQELLLFNKTKRTMALPIGKALFMFGTCKPSARDPISIPDVCISGKALPRGNTVTLDLDIPAEMIHWCEFHSGVATGLRIDPMLSDIDSQWMLYNRPQELSNKHAGFLFSLGLTGHLAKLSSRNLHDYLCQRHKFTSIGLLLGLGVTNRGTQDETATKLFSIHVPALLPPSAIPLELDHLVQTAAVAGLGLVYIGSAHRRMAEIMLDEIGRPPGPEMDNCEDREGYSLACGFSLGLILLGMGNESLPGLDDLKVTDRLYKYINGGKKRQHSPLVPPSFRIWEGSMINTSVSSIGAIVALGLTFLKTGNKNIARTLAAPHTEYLLEGVRPDILLLRSACYGLILWEHVVPTVDWINCQVPEVLLDCLELVTGVVEDTASVTMSVDPDTAFPCTLTILAGGCFAMALRFAGTANNAAFKTIMFYLKRIHYISLHPKDFPGFSKDLTEMCLVCLVVSVSIVMAGTGNLEVMRVIRKLRKRIVPVNTYGHNFVTYGCHIAIHMSLGLLFLGGGKYSLKRDNLSVAALFLSFYPIFQTCQDDNTYHLQAFRHLWVIAAEPRLLVTIDEDTNKPCNVPVTITTTADCVSGDNTPHDVSRTVFTPVMLPEFHTIKQFAVIGERYWTAVVRDVESLRKGFIYVKKRTGYLEYRDDPQGKINLLGRTFGDRYSTSLLDTIGTFSRDEKILLYADMFCASAQRGSHDSLQFCRDRLLSCLVEERFQYLPYYTGQYATLQHSVLDTWTVQSWRLLLAFFSSRETGFLISKKLLSKIRHKLNQLTDAPLITPHLEPTLDEVTRQCLNILPAHVTKSRINHRVISSVNELVSENHSADVTTRFMELLSIAGV